MDEPLAAASLEPGTEYDTVMGFEAWNLFWHHTGGGIPPSYTGKSGCNDWETMWRRWQGPPPFQSLGLVHPLLFSTAHVGISIGRPPFVAGLETTRRLDRRDETFHFLVSFGLVPPLPPLFFYDDDQQGADHIYLKVGLRGDSLI